jgi:hypothetical protein
VRHVVERDAVGLEILAKQAREVGVVVDQERSHGFTPLEPLG